MSGISAPGQGITHGASVLAETTVLDRDGVRGSASRRVASSEGSDASDGFGVMSHLYGGSGSQQRMTKAVTHTKPEKKGL